MATGVGESSSHAGDAGSFECNICFDLAQDPIVTLCGHLFCWPCLYKWLHVHAHSSECPVCKAVVDESNLVPLYGRGKAPSDPRSRSSVPNRPTGQRPATAPHPPPHAHHHPQPHPDHFPHAANPWFMGGGVPRMGNYTFSAAIGGLGGLFPMLNFQVHGFPEVAAPYGSAAGFPYGYANPWTGAHGHGIAQGFHRQMSQGQQADVYLKALLVLVGALVLASLFWF